MCRCLIPFHGRIMVHFVESLSIHSSQCICSSFDAYLSCFHLLAVMNNVTTNICVQAFMWVYVFILRGHLCLGVDLLCHTPVLFTFLGKHHTLLHSSRTILNYHQHCNEASRFLQILTYTCLCFFPF